MVRLSNLAKLPSKSKSPASWTSVTSSEAHPLSAFGGWRPFWLFLRDAKGWKDLVDCNIGVCRHPGPCSVGFALEVGVASPSFLLFPLRPPLRCRCRDFLVLAVACESTVCGAIGVAMSASSSSVVSFWSRSSPMAGDLPTAALLALASIVSLFSSLARGVVSRIAV